MEFFRNGGFGMYPVLVFGFLAVASAVLFLLRQERRYVRLMVALGVTTLTAGLLGLTTGLINIFRYAQHVSDKDQVTVVTLGISEYLHPVALALILTVT